MSRRFARLLDAVPSSVASRFDSAGVAARVLRPLVNSGLPAAQTVVSVRSGPSIGTRLPIHPRTEKFYWTGLHEREVQDILVELLRPGMVFWDVGAHIGYHSLLAARLVGPTGRVHAFEPMPENRARLVRAAELNDVANIRVDPRALAPEGGAAVLVPHDASLMWRLGGTGDDGVAVESVTLGDAAEELGAPDLIKLDVEGLETALVAAASELVSSGTAVLAETTAAKLETEPWIDGSTLRPVGAHHVLVTSA